MKILKTVKFLLDLNKNKEVIVYQLFFYSGPK